MIFYSYASHYQRVDMKKSDFTIKNVDWMVNLKRCLLLKLFMLIVRVKSVKSSVFVHFGGVTVTNKTCGFDQI